MFKKPVTILLCSTLSLYAVETEKLLDNENNNTTLPYDNPIVIKTVRGILGANDPIQHTRGQLRAATITFRENSRERNSAYALGGHLHLGSKRWNGFEIGLSAYTVLDLGINQNKVYLNPDFFDTKGKSFIQLTEAYLDGKWGGTEIKLGRQILNTPHADSDDIRMIPNYFEAYTISNTDIEDLTLQAGLITKMAGWENGIDASDFINTGKVLGTEETEGIFYASALYDGFKEMSLSLWYYHYRDIAEILYAEAGYHIHPNKELLITLGLQYDGSRETGLAFLGEQDANTYGISMELSNETLGIHMLAAYNKDSGNTGATDLSLGGGPLFTSMEDQTLDAIGRAGSAWIIAAGYHFEAIGIEGLNAGIAYGHFSANDTSNYGSNEVDVVIEYSFSQTFSLTAAYASVNFSHSAAVDHDQFRVITNYNF